MQSQGLREPKYLSNITILLIVSLALPVVFCVFSVDTFLLAVFCRKSIIFNSVALFLSSAKLLILTHVSFLHAVVISLLLTAASPLSVVEYFLVLSVEFCILAVDVCLLSTTVIFLSFEMLFFIWSAASFLLVVGVTLL